MGERISTWLTGCFREDSFVDSIDALQMKHPHHIKEEYRKRFENRIVKIKVIETSRLELNPNVMHPFVRIHILDKDKGCYLKRY